MSKAIEATIAYLRDRKTAFKFTFSYTNPASRQVLEDLARFCRASESCAVPGDHDRTMLLLGRQEVWLRIQEYIQLSPEQLFELKTGKGTST